MKSKRISSRTKEYQKKNNNGHPLKPWNIERKKRCLSYINFSNFYLGHPKRTSTSAFLPVKKYKKKSVVKLKLQQKKHGIFDNTVDLMILPLVDHQGKNVTKSLFFVCGKKTKLKRSKQKKGKPKVHFRVFDPSIPTEEEKCKTSRFRRSSRKKGFMIPRRKVRPKTSLGFHHDHMKRKKRLRMLNTKRFPSPKSKFRRRVEVGNTTDRVIRATSPKSSYSSSPSSSKRKSEEKNEVEKPQQPHQNEKKEQGQGQKRRKLRRSFSIPQPMTVSFYHKINSGGSFHDKKTKRTKRRGAASQPQNQSSVRLEKKRLHSTRIRRRNSFQVVKRKKFVNRRYSSSFIIGDNNNDNNNNNNNNNIINNNNSIKTKVSGRKTGTYVVKPSEFRKKRPSTAFSTSPFQIGSSPNLSISNHVRVRPASAFPRERIRLSQGFEKKGVEENEEEEEEKAFLSVLETTPLHTVSRPLSIIGECDDLDESDSEEEEEIVEISNITKKLFQKVKKGRKAKKKKFKFITSNRNRKRKKAKKFSVSHFHHRDNKCRRSSDSTVNRRRSLDDRNVIVTVKRCFIQGKEKPNGIVLPRPRVLYE